MLTYILWPQVRFVIWTKTWSPLPEMVCIACRAARITAVTPAQQRKPAWPIPRVVKFYNSCVVRLLFSGIAINKDGVIFFADGANIRVINKQGQISTLIGHQQQPSAYKPLPCNTTTSIEEVSLRWDGGTVLVFSFPQVTLLWPTALAINPLDDTLFVLDNNMVHKVTKDGRLLVVAGRPLHCPMTSDQYSSLLNEEHAGPKMANEEILISPQHISFSPHGDLFIVESDERYVNRIRMVRTDGTIVHYVGARPKCSCNEPGCKCFEPKEVLATKVLLHKPTAVTVTADSVLHVADMGNLRVLSVVATLPEPDR